MLILEALYVRDPQQRYWNSYLILNKFCLKKDTPFYNHIKILKRSIFYLESGITKEQFENITESPSVLRNCKISITMIKAFDEHENMSYALLFHPIVSGYILFAELTARLRTGLLCYLQLFE
jgi:hypothetical protein